MSSKRTCNVCGEPENWKRDVRSMGHGPAGYCRHCNQVPRPTEADIVRAERWIRATAASAVETGHTERQVLNANAPQLLQLCGAEAVQLAMSRLGYDVTAR